MTSRIIGTLVSTLLFTANANAATMTITGPSDVFEGDSFQVQIWGDFDVDGLLAGGITFSLDAALVQLDGVTFNLPVDNQLSCPGSANCPAPAANSMPNVWGEFLVDLIGSGAGQTLMATLDVTALGPGTANFGMADVPALTGGWFGAGFVAIAAPTFSGLSVVIDGDTDGDGIPNSLDDDDDNDGVDDVDETIAGTDPLDPDSDDDGIGDAYDNNPLTNNSCNGASAIFDELEVIGTTTCAAASSITVSPMPGSLVEVLATGNLRLIAPIISFESGFTVIGFLTVISADPCPGCTPP